MPQVLGGQKLKFSKDVHGHIKSKEVVSRTGYKQSQIGDIGWGQISLNFFENMEVCDGAPSTVSSSFVLPV